MLAARAAGVAVVPLAGTWIEIQYLGSGTKYPQIVVPLAGTWIEIGM